MDANTFPITSESEAATQAAGRAFASTLIAPETILLEGAVGAGKTSFVRAVLQALAGEAIEVPSPTFPIVQTYELPVGDVWHVDLYRVSSPAEVIELGLVEAMQTSICFIEWPDRLGQFRPVSAKTLRFSPVGDTARRIELLEGISQSGAAE
ncbi:MAG: tRNA (adenosine(37)-N6)-threonylcarbamoyltransferase complex ATPase subunit type 1 TsaE [Shimia sp.]